MSTPRPRCAYCGRPIPYATTLIDAPREPDSYVPVTGWEYRGNQQVVHRQYDDVLVQPNGKTRFISPTEADPDAWDYKTDEERQGTRERRLSKVSLWNGEHYLFSYWPFCTGTCAGRFADEAYDAGYRRKEES